MRKQIFLAILAVVGVILSALAFHFAFGIVAGVTLAGVVSGTIDSEVIADETTEVLTDEYSQKITLMNPSRTPLDVILSMIKPVSCKSWEYNYYAVENRPFSDTVATAYTGAKAYETASIEVSNIDMWAKHDLAMINGTTGDDGFEYVLYIYDKDVENNCIKVQGLNCLGSGALATKHTVPSISKSAVLTRLGAAKNEKDAQTSVVTMLPDQSTQYVQIFMAQIEEGIYAAEHNKNIPFNWVDMAKQLLYDFKATKELTLLFGYKAKITDKLDAKSKYLTGGVTRDVGQNLEYGLGSGDLTYTYDDLIDHSKSIFASNSGSRSRVLFCGSGLMAALMKIKSVQDSTTDVYVDHVVKQLAGDSTKVTYGIEFKSIKTNFGEINAYYHPLLDEAGWDNNGLVLDLENLEKIVWKPLSKRPIDLISSGQSLVKAEVLEEICGLVLRYPDTHATIKPAA